MLSEIIKEIANAEKEAEGIVLAANEEAKAIVAQAEKERSKIVAEGKKAAADLLSELESETDRLAKKEEESILSRGKAQTAALEETARNKINDAADRIGKALFEEYGVTTF